MPRHDDPTMNRSEYRAAPAADRSPARRRLLLATGGVLLLPAWVRAERQVQRVHDTLFGSPIELSAAGGPRAAAALSTVLLGLRHLHREWNAWKPGGELGRLNRALRGGRAAPVSPALRRMIVDARALEQQTAGLFNPAIGGLVATWGFHDDDLRPGPRPADADIAAWRDAAPSLSQLRLDGLQVSAAQPRLQLDFGAYAKGVAADWALGQLRRRGVTDAVIDLGGNIAAMGRAGDGPAARAWRIGLRDPVSTGLLATLALEGQEAVVTSGTYERYRLVDGQPLAHVIDPRRGAPAGELVSLTVVHPSAARADAAATALLVAGPSGWPALAARLGLTQVLAIDRHGQASATTTLARRLNERSPGLGPLRLV